MRTGQAPARLIGTSHFNLPVTFKWYAVPFDALGQQDFQWYKDHTGYTPYP
jgi:hypothetical protein